MTRLNTYRHRHLVWPVCRSHQTLCRHSKSKVLLESTTLTAHTLSVALAQYLRTATSIRSLNPSHGISVDGRKISGGPLSSGSCSVRACQRQPGGTKVPSTWRVLSASERSASGHQTSCLNNCWKVIRAVKAIESSIFPGKDGGVHLDCPETVIPLVTGIVWMPTLFVPTLGMIWGSQRDS